MYALKLKPSMFFRLDSNSPFQDYSGFSRSGTLSGAATRGISLVADAAYSQKFSRDAVGTFASNVFVAGRENEPFSLAATLLPSNPTESVKSQTYRENIGTAGVMNILGVGNTLAMNQSWQGHNNWYKFNAASINTGVRYNIPSQLLTDGETYTISLKVSAASAVTLSVDWADASYAPSTTLSPTEIKTITFNGTRSVYNSTYRFLDIISNTAGVDIYIKDIFITPGANQNSVYFDGGYVGAEWAGTPGASVSRTRKNISRINYAQDPEATNVGYTGNIGSGNYGVSIDNSVFYSGNSSLKMTVTSTGSVGRKFMLPGSQYLHPGTNIKWRVMVRSTVACNLSPYFETSSPNYAGGVGGAPVAVPANTWTPIVGEVTLGANNGNRYNYGFGFFQAGGTIGVGESVWLDQGLIEINVDSLGTYFSGNTSGAGWSGPQNASPSFTYVSNSDQQILSNQGLYDGLSINGTVVSFSTSYLSLPEAKCSYDVGEYKKIDVVGTHTETKNSLYINGELVAEIDISAEQAVGTYASPNSNLYSGQTASAQQFLGNNFASFPTALNTEQVKAMYDANNTVALGDIPAMFGGTTLPISERDRFLDVVWQYDDDWLDADYEFCAVEQDQLTAMMNNGVTLEGVWQDSVDLYFGDTPLTIDSINMSWDGKGEMVHVSVDGGNTWADATNGSNLSIIPTGFDPSNKSLLIKITFMAGLTEAFLNNLRVKGFLSNTQTIQNRTITYNNPVSTNSELKIFDFNSKGVTRLSGGSLIIGADTSGSPQDVRTVEIWFKVNSLPQEDVVLLDGRNQVGAPIVALNYASTGNQTAVNASRYLDGVSLGTGSASLPNINQWYCMHIILISNQTNQFYINRRYTGSGSADINIGRIALYPTALTNDEVSQTIACYTGIPVIRQDDSSAVALSEPVASSIFYAHDWEILTT